MRRISSKRGIKSGGNGFTLNFLRQGKERENRFNQMGGGKKKEKMCKLL